MRIENSDKRKKQRKKITSDNKKQINNNIKKKHNGIISLWKFLYCMMIVIFHGEIFAKSDTNKILANGSIGVEFFFLVSGYLMTKSALNQNNNSNIANDTVNFIWKKWKKFLPYTIISGLIALFLINFHSKQYIIYNIISSIWSITILTMAGFRGVGANLPIWYISSMLMGMMILYPLIRKFKLNFMYLFVPILLIVGFGFLNLFYGNLRNPETIISFTFKGNIRCVLELLLGGIIYILCEKFKKIDFTKFGLILITIIEITCLTIPIIISHFINESSRYDFIVLIIIAIGVLIAFSEKTLEYNILCNKFSYWLEKLSLTIYIFHYSVRVFCTYYSGFKKINYINKLTIYTFLSIIVGIIMMYFIDYLKKNNFYLDKIKKLIIKSEA